MLEGRPLGQKGEPRCEVEGRSVLGRLVREHRYPSARGSVASGDAHSIVAGKWHDPRGQTTGVLMEEWQETNRRGNKRQSNGKQSVYRSLTSSSISHSSSR